MKNYLFLFFVILFSCQKENPYKTALKQYLAKDLTRLQQNIDYNRDQLEMLSNERPKKYNSSFKIISKTDSLFTDFEEKNLHQKNIDSINKSLQKLKTSLLACDTKHIDIFDEVINKIPSKINTELDRILIFHQVKTANSKLSDFPFRGQLNSSIFCGFTTTFVFPSRVNDSTVIMHVADQAVRDKPSSFDIEEEFYIQNLTDKNNQKLHFNRISREPYFTSFVINTTSDTLNLKASLKTNKKIGLVLSKYDSIIIVGEKTLFKYKDYRKYFDVINK